MMMRKASFVAASSLATAAVALGSYALAAVAAEPSAAWHHRAGSAEYHLEALLLLQTLNADLLSHDSATLTLERWCADQHLAASPKIVVERVRGAEKAPTAEQLTQLGVKDAASVRYRQVKLMCGSVVLSEADNWYVPERLTREINKVLDTTDTPFGRAVQALNFRRHTISARVLAQLLPERWWELRSADLAAQAQGLCLPAHVLEHRAILSLPDGTPFSEVVETYTANVLTAMRGKISECPP